MKILIYKGLYATLLKLSNRFNIRLLSKYKILLGTALLVITSSCSKGGEKEGEIENPPTCYLIGPTAQSESNRQIVISDLNEGQEGKFPVPL